MAFSIYIYENDETIFTSLKIRLSHYFSDAYIINPSENKINKDISDFTIILYDNRQFRMPEKKTTQKCEYIPLYTDDGNNNAVIDCSRLVLLIKNTLNNTNSNNSPTGKLNLLLPFAYIDDRENFINKHFINSPTSNQYIIRIDLMSGIRMPSSFKTGADTGSLTELLKDAGKSDFTPDRILDYLNPDSLGFLSPGKPLHPDDVFDVPTSQITLLISNFRRLVQSQELKSDGLVVCEGWKTTDVLNYVTKCDDVHLLLPSRNCDEIVGMKDYIGAIKRSLTTNSTLNIHYCDDYKTTKTKELINAAANI